MLTEHTPCPVCDARVRMLYGTAADYLADPSDDNLAALREATAILAPIVAAHRDHQGHAYSRALQAWRVPTGIGL